MHKEKTKCLLQYFEIDRTYQGYEYCIYCMDLISKNPESLAHVTKSIYPDVAKKFNTNCDCVERDIRTIAEVIWKKGGKKYFSEMTGFEFAEERPSNSKFLAILSNCVIWEDYPCKNCKFVIELNSRIDALNATIQWMHDLIWEMSKRRH